jgi:hypothetical protein
MGKYNDYEDNIVKRMIAEREKKQSETVNKVKKYLLKIKYYSLEKEKKIEYLVSEEGLTLIEGMSAENLPLVTMARCLGLTQKELHDASRENPVIFDAIDRGRTEKLNIVEESLFNMAKDRYITEEKTYRQQSGRSDRETVRTEEYKKWVGANFYAVKYILDRKRAMEYKEKTDDLSNLGSGVNFIIVFDDDEGDEVSNE